MGAGPIVKWAGGKGQLLAQYAPHLPPPDAYDAYLEPFVGGGALFFHLAPALAGKMVWLNDQNADLINLYEVVRSDVDGLIRALARHRDLHDSTYYYRIRDWEPADPVERAARLLYLNKTCYNGLYRVNSHGRFNVPLGRYRRPAILDEEGLRAAHRLFHELHVVFASGDFSGVLDVLRARPGIHRAFVYFDPPYQPISPTAYFTSYTAAGFDEEGQRELAQVARMLRDMGHLVVVSNSYHALIEELYQGFRLIPVHANRAINSQANGRSGALEYLVLGSTGGGWAPTTPSTA